MRRLMRALKNERGATAALFAIMLVPIMGVLAISLDVGSLYVERSQLQNGADAAALAVAADCADSDGCTTPVSTAASFASENANDGTATTLAPTFPTQYSVTVKASTRNTDGSTAIQHPFAQFIGIDSTTVHAEATAEWGGPESGNVLPLAVAYCEVANITKGQRVLIQYDTNKPCKGPIGQPINGGFGWLDQTPGECEAFVDLDSARLGSNPGLDPPKNCSTIFSTLEGEVVYIPIYDSSPSVNGQKGQFHIMAFAALDVTGWKFTGNGNSIMNNPDPLAPDCSGNCRGIQGFWVDQVEVGGDWSLGGPNLGLSIVRLTN
jgi:Flp pilus assembly protein TadG